MAYVATAPDERFMRHIFQDYSGCWLWTAFVNKATGYGKFRLGTVPSDPQLGARRAAYMIFRGEPGGLCVLHTCDVRHCVNPAHLFLGTNKENTHDMMAKNRHSYGEKRPLAKLTVDSVAAILADKRTHQAIADDHGVCRATITHIKRGKTWKHVSRSHG